MMLKHPKRSCISTHTLGENIPFKLQLNKIICVIVCCE